MANSKIIIVEGAQGAGKTTVTDFIRYSMPYTNLYRLCGTSDASSTGLAKSTKMYKDLQDYIKTLENLNINLLFDRTFFTEEVYCRLGYKDYNFTEVYKELLKKLANMDFDIYYITLYLEDEKLFSERLKRKDKATTEYAKFEAEKSIQQQRMYLKLADEILEEYPKIKVCKIENGRDFEQTKQELNSILF